MPRKRVSPPKVVAVTLGLVALLVLGLLAYGAWRAASAPSAADLARAAEEARAERDYRAAIIHYKSAIQAAPEDPALRWALGRLHLELDHYAEALNHLRLARALAETQPQVLLDLARAEVELGKFDDAARTLAAYQGDDAAASAGLEARVNHALGQTDEARALIAAQREKSPESADLALAEARMALAEKDLPGAMQALTSALEHDPGNAEAQTLMGMARLQEGDTGLAAAHFKAAVTHAANPLVALTGLAEAELLRGERKAAREAIDQIAARAPKAQMLPYLRGWLAWSRKDWPQAEANFLQALKVMPTQPRLLLMLADTNIQQEEYNQAEAHLKSLESVAPNLPLARKLRGRAQLLQQRPLDAIATLTPLAASDKVETSILIMLGQAHGMAGEQAQSEKYLARARAVVPEGPLASALDAVSNLSAGRLEAGITALESLQESDLAGASTRALAMTHAWHGEGEAALESARDLVKIAPEDPASHQLLGALLLGSGKPDEARAAFEEALRRAPAYAPAETGLAQLALQAGEGVKAEAHLRAALKGDKTYTPAASALAALLLRAGKTVEADAMLDSAIAANPEAGAPRWQRAERHLQEGDREKGLAEARKALALAPTAAANRLRWGIFLLSAGAGVEAVGVLKALVESDPEASMARAALARAAQATGQWSLARAQYEALLAQVPDHGPSLWALLGLELAARDYPAAEAVAARLQKAQPDTQAGLLAQAEILAAKGEHTAALKAFRKVHRAEANTRSLLRLTDAMLSAGKAEAARAGLRDWVAGHPEDLASRLRLAELSLQAGEQDAAMADYESLLEQAPDHPVALNNLAWLYDQRRDPRALATAEKAVEAMPRSAEALDTLGWILVRDDAAEKALPWLEKAQALAPAAPDIAFHHAYALAETGKKLQAERLVTALLDAHADFGSVTDAKALLRRLQSEDEAPDVMR